MRFRKVTSNLAVSDINTSLKFYEQVLGLKRRLTVPGSEPFVFVSVVEGEGEVELFLNQHEQPTKPRAGSMSLYMEMEGLEELLARVQRLGLKIEMPLKETFYGMCEFAVLDPDGYMLIFAEPVAR